MYQQQQPMYQQQPMMQQPMMQQPGMQQPMMQQQIIQPIMVVQQANPYSYMSALEKFRNVMGVYVKQKPQIFEALSGCEMDNVYKVYAANNDGEKNKKLLLFKCKEKSSCCAKSFMQSAARPFKMYVEHDNKDEQGNEGNEALFFEREYKCTVCCFNRPEMFIFLTENGQKTYLGKVTNPWTACDLEIRILNHEEQTKYILTGSCCQAGVFFPGCPCEACETVNFEIRDEHGNKLGEFQKRSPGCAKAALSDADNFSLLFPSNASPEERALLTAGLILMDFTYFEEKKKGQDNG